MDSFFWNTFVELVGASFRHLGLIWGIVPLYFGLLLNELTSAKASFRTAIQTGFSFLWAGTQWLYPYFREPSQGRPTIDFGALLHVSLFVTFAVIIIGAVALFSGLRHRYPKYCSFLGYTRFSNYFMIMLFPIQAHELTWTWDRLAAIFIYAIPAWLVLHFGLMPLRKS